ncbi:alpha/beta hydrolase family esterase [uncultured Enterovirga sp.]|uniref:extracellular catalytic domain type 1 short-chain-length polyhydroxyalkanoate depolymerase n=1 Tax=uncultured Enterovirga sp. TaxID=2026352 RepID=UPI0035CA502A
MAGLRATTLDLSSLRKRWQEAVRSGSVSLADSTGAGSTAKLQPVAGFGSNPGALQMFTYVPESLPAAPAMVVVLHGCTQTAAGYAVGAGWDMLAEHYGFVLVCPQQPSSNNPKSCFNWFQPGDTTRGAGEALSIREMIERAATDHNVDRSRIFVTGLSAGGAMAAVMLATYPEVFAGGGIVAGLPYGAAANVQQALHAMFQGDNRPAGSWGDLVRAASPHHGPWPRLSIWHGASDGTVKPGNARELVKQWTDVHGLPAVPTETGVVDGHPRELWRDASGREVLESFTIAGMGHGAPLAVGTDDDNYGATGPFLLEVGISSSYHMAAFWGLLSESDSAAPHRPRAVSASAPAGSVALVSPDGSIEMTRSKAPRPSPSSTDKVGAQPAPERPGDVGAIISNALRAAGLMK